LNPAVSKELGTRHRAAIGITEETDAVAVVVSEETGTISVVREGEIERGFDGVSLRRRLEEILEPAATRRAAEPIRQAAR
jgi:diadenylate cyclase